MVTKKEEMLILIDMGRMALDGMPEVKVVGNSPTQAKLAVIYIQKTIPILEKLANGS